MARNKRQKRRIEAAGNAELTIRAQAVVTPGVEAAGDTPARKPTVAIRAYSGGAMRVPRYFDPVVVDVRGIGTGQKIPLLRDHDHTRPIGQGVAAIADNGIEIQGSLRSTGDSGQVRDAREIIEAAKDEFPWQASVGIEPTRTEKVNAGQRVRVNGQTFTGPLTVVRAGKLREVSIVAIGADDSTEARIAAAAAGGQTMGFDAWLEAKGWDKATLNDVQLRALEAAWKAETGGDTGSQGGGQSNAQRQQGGQDAGFGNAGGNSGGNGQTVTAMLNEARRREERNQQYGDILGRFLSQGTLTASEAESQFNLAQQTQPDPRDFELQLLRNSHRHGSTPGHQAGRSGEQSAEVVEAALARAAGVYDLEANYSERTLEQVDRHYPRGLTLVELMYMAAQRGGYRGHSYRFSEEVLRAAYAPIEARGASTYDLSGVLSNVANKAIMAGFMSVEQEWARIAKIASVTDFKTVTRYALTGGFEYEQLGPSGEIKHATMGAESYTNKANLYARLFAIGLEDLRNDDLSAFDTVRQRLGRGAALRINQVFWTEYLADVATFYTAGRNNYFDGAASNLQSSSLQTAEQKFREQTDPDGNPLGLMPTFLVVPPALAVTARELYVATNINTGGSSTKDKVPNANVFQSRYQPIVSSYLGSNGVTNGSDTHFFLQADPMDLPLIEVVFLDGQRQPRVEAAQADFDQLGIQMRGYHAFGAAKQEYRAGVRSKGAA